LGINDTVVTVKFNNLFQGNDALKKITVTAGNACGSSAAVGIILLKNLPAQPTSITGPTNACENAFAGTDATYKISKANLADGYVWSLSNAVNARITSHPAGTGVNDTIIKVHYDSAFYSGRVKVASSRNCGLSAVTTLAVTKLAPAASTAITGVLTPCAGTTQVYTAATVANARAYIWTIPYSATLSGQGSRSVSVSFKSNFTGGSISVKAVSLCGTSDVKTINVNKCSAAARTNNSAAFSNAAKQLAGALAMQVYPNPSKGSFVIGLSQSKLMQSVRLRINNQLGQTVYEKTTGANTQTLQLNINEALPAGTYFIHCVVDGQLLTRKIEVL
jgi:hypothetical protein